MAPNTSTKIRFSRKDERAKQSFEQGSIRASSELQCWRPMECGVASQDCQSLSYLAASHIVPWSIDVSNRTNPRNGLCLNSIHDRAFDCGLLTVTPEFKVKVSPRISRKSAD